MNQKEKELTIQLLTEKIERITGKKVKFLKEISTKIQGTTKIADDKFIDDIKEFFKKQKGTTLVNINVVGNLVNVDFRAPYESDNENLSMRRVDANQEVYDIKQKFEDFLNKRYDITPVTITSGTIVKMDDVSTQFTFMYVNTSWNLNNKIQYESVDKKEIKATREGKSAIQAIMYMGGEDEESTVKLIERFVTKMDDWNKLMEFGKSAEFLNYDKLADIFYNKAKKLNLEKFKKLVY